jgi:hypothetical protein
MKTVVFFGFNLFSILGTQNRVIVGTIHMTEWVKVEEDLLRFIDWLKLGEQRNRPHVSNDEKEFDMLMKRVPLSLRANLYVMLIDLEWGKILKEEILCRYRKD